MKKIILAVASVLALGLFASCQREISGDLTVTNNNTGDNWTKRYAYVLSGTYSQTVTTTSYGAKASGAAEAATGTSVRTTTYTPKSVKVDLTITERRNDNAVTYSYNIGDFESQTKTVSTPTGGAATTSYSFVNTTAVTNKTITVYKVDGKYYLRGVNESYLIPDFNPTADTIDFSKLSDPKSVSSTAYTGDTWTSAGAIDTYTGKTVTVTEGEKYALTLTKIK